MLEHLSHSSEQPTDTTLRGPETDLFSFLEQLLPRGVMTRQGGDSVFTASVPDTMSVPELWTTILHHLDTVPDVQDIAQGPSGVCVTYATDATAEPRHLEIIVAPRTADTVAE